MNVTDMYGDVYPQFAGITDSGGQVASFSSRGNVGVGMEGDAGRFKPDVVAPGVFIVSTRAAGWMDPVGGADVLRFDFNSQHVMTGRTNMFPHCP